MNVQTINDNVRTFCFFILRATPWCWPPPTPYQRRRHLSCRSNRGHWSPTALAEHPWNTPYAVAAVVVPHTEHPPSVQHGGRDLPAHPLHGLQTKKKTPRITLIIILYSSIIMMTITLCNPKVKK